MRYYLGTDCNAESVYRETQFLFYEDLLLELGRVIKGVEKNVYCISDPGCIKFVVEYSNSRNYGNKGIHDSE